MMGHNSIPPPPIDTMGIIFFLTYVGTNQVVTIVMGNQNILQPLLDQESSNGASVPVTIFWSRNSY